MSFESGAEAVAAFEDSVDLFSGLEDIIDLSTNQPLPDFSTFDKEVEEFINGAFSENSTNCEESGAPVSLPNLVELLQNNQEFTSSMLEPFLSGLLGES